VKPLRHLVAMWQGDSPSLIVLGRIVVAGLALVSAPIIARAIGPEGRGETATAAALAYLLPVVLGLGIPIEVRRRLAGTGDASVLRTARIVAAMLFPFGLVLAWIAYGSIFSTFESQARIWASLLLVLAPLTVSWLSDTSAYLATGRLRSYFAIQVTQPTVYLLGVLVFWLSGAATTATVLTSSATATVVTFLVGIFLSRSLPRRTPVRVLSLVRGGVRFAGAGIAEAVANRIDQVIVLPLIGAVQAGYYSVAVTIGTVPLAFAHALGSRYFNALSSAVAAGEEDLTVIKGRSFRSSLAVGLLIAGCLATASPMAIPLLFGQGFAPAVVPTLVALVGSVFMVAAYVASLLLAAEARGGRMTVAQVVSAAVGVGALTILGPMLGALGAALASVVGYLVLLLLGGLFLRLRGVDWLVRPGDFARGMHDLLRGSRER